MIFKEISSVGSFFWNMLSDPTIHKSRKGRKLFTKSGSFFCQLCFGKLLNSNLVKCKNNLSTNKILLTRAPSLPGLPTSPLRPVSPWKYKARATFGFAAKFLNQNESAVVLQKIVYTFSHLTFSNVMSPYSSLGCWMRKKNLGKK